jgi:hypothetical protein
MLFYTEIKKKATLTSKIIQLRMNNLTLWKTTYFNWDFQLLLFARNDGVSNNRVSGKCNQPVVSKISEK